MKKSHQLPSLLTSVVIAAFVITTFGYYEFKLEQRDIATVGLNARLSADLVADRLQRYMDDRVAVVRVVQNRLSSGTIITDQEYENWALDVTKEFGGFQALNRVNKDGTIYQVVPLLGNEKALNLDLSTNPDAWASFSYVRRNGGYAATRPLNLAQGGTGVVIYLALYDANDEFVGALNAVFRTTDMLADCFKGPIATQYDCIIRDSNIRLVTSLEPENETENFERGRFYAARQVQVGGRNWDVELQPKELIMASASTPLHKLIGGLGVLLGVLLGFVSYYIMNSRNRLRIQNAHLEALFHAHPDVQVRLDQQGNILEVRAPDEAKLHFIAGNPEVGLPFRTAVTLDVWEGYAQGIQRLAEGTPRHQLEYEIRNDSETIYFEASLQLIANQEIFVVIRNITHQRLAEYQLRESEERYRILVENAPEAIVVIDVSSNCFSDANQNACELFGCDRASLLKLSPSQLSPEIQQNGLRSEDMIPVHVARAIKGESHAFEWMHKTVDGHEFPCEVHLVRLPSSHSEMVRGSIFDISERKSEERRQKLLMDELDHRVKNNMAAVAALTTQTISTCSTLEQFRGIFIGRIEAMARTHDLLSASRWRGAYLAQLVAIILEPLLLSNESDSVQYNGDEIRLPARTTGPIALTLHELMTNSLKYGALSAPGGRLSVEWALDANRRIVLDWTEADGPPVQEPNETGLGMRLIRGFIEHELGGSATIRFVATGLFCQLVIPLDEMNDHWVTPRHHAEHFPQEELK